MKRSEIEANARKPYADALMVQQAEIEALRNALQEIDDVAYVSDEGAVMRSIARQALKAKPRDVKVYIALCKTSDNDCGVTQTEVVGAYTDESKARASFTEVVIMPSERGDGTWESKHICFRGTHEIEVYEPNKRGHVRGGWIHVGVAQ